METPKIRPGWAAREMRFGEFRLFPGPKGPLWEKLKTRLVEIVRDNLTINALYFAKIQFENETSKGPIVCIKAIFGGEDEAVFYQIGGIFASLFIQPETLEVHYLKDEHEPLLRKIVAPFYEKHRLRETATPFEKLLTQTSLICPHAATHRYPILQAVRVEPEGPNDSGWQLYCNCGLKELRSEAHLAPLREIVAREAGLEEYLDLPVGTVVWRHTPRAKWVAWRNGEPIPEAKPNPGLGRPGQARNGHNGKNGHNPGPDGPGQVASNGHGTNGATEADDEIRQYLTIRLGHYPSDDDLYYECLGCGEIIESLAKPGTRCRCGNFSISASTTRIDVRDQSKLRLFRQKL
jgi:hypothetical protein